jgi:hypothetical protein
VKEILVLIALLRVVTGLRKVENRRKFFDEFAKSQNFHPLDAEKWYRVTGQQIKKAVR